MNTHLAGKVALVTGATSGFGEACAGTLARAGATVIATGRRQDRLDALAARLGAKVHPLLLDVRDRAAVERAIHDLPAPLAAIDVLVNNAGLALGLEPAQRASLDDWDTMIATNCRGLVTMTRAVLPGMVERNRGHAVSVVATQVMPTRRCSLTSPRRVHRFRALSQEPKLSPPTGPGGRRLPPDSAMRPRAQELFG